MDPVANLARVLDDARAIIDTVSTDDLPKPTPCTGWDVGTLVQHMIGVATIYARAFAGGERASPADPGGAAATCDELSASYRQASADLLEAARAPGYLDRTIKLVSVELPGHLAIRMVLAEQLLHTWDLAQAVGRPFTMDESLAAATLEGLQQVLAALPGARGEGRAFEPEVPCPADASAQARLLAYSGRRP
jgi:uncharacterized protein (TIGR03086 family)